MEGRFRKNKKIVLKKFYRPKKSFKRIEKKKNFIKK